MPRSDPETPLKRVPETGHCPECRDDLPASPIRSSSLSLSIGLPLKHVKRRRHREKCLVVKWCFAEARMAGSWRNRGLSHCAVLSGSHPCRGRCLAAASAHGSSTIGPSTSPTSGPGVTTMTGRDTGCQGHRTRQAVRRGSDSAKLSPLSGASRYRPVAQPFEETSTGPQPLAYASTGSPGCLRGERPSAISVARVAAGCGRSGVPRRSGFRP